MENFQIKGHWWLPDAPQEKITGTLSFSKEDGGTLELDDLFSEEDSARIHEPPIILGISQNGKSYTLYKTLYTSWTLPILGLGTAKYFTHLIFEGIHFENPESIRFHQLYADYRNLDAWIDTYGFKINWEYGDDRPARATIEYIKPDKHLVDIDDNFRVGIGFSIIGPTKSIVQSEVAMKQKAYLIVEYKSGDIDFETLRSILRVFEDLHQIAAQRLCNPLEIIGYSDINVVQHDGRPPYYPDVRIYYKPIEIAHQGKEMIPQEMLFLFRDLSDEQLIKWFSTYKKHKTQIELYRTLFYSGIMFGETKFLNITQALEALHSTLFESNYLSNEEFNKRRQTVVASIPVESREWTNDALSNANYKRLKQKITELFETKVKLFELAINDIYEFSERVRDTRNQFVHQRKHAKSFGYGKELISATVLLRFLFESYVLDMIDLSKEKVDQIFSKRVKGYLSWAQKF